MLSDAKPFEPQLWQRSSWQQPATADTLTNSGGVNVNISQATIAGTGFTMSGLNPSTGPYARTALHLHRHLYTALPRKLHRKRFDRIERVQPEPVHTAERHGDARTAGTVDRISHNIPFGNVIVGTNAQQNGTLSATGQSVIVSSQNVTGSAFAVTGLSFPVTIPAGQHVQFTVTFTPHGNWRGIRQCVICQQRFEFADTRDLHRHRHPSPAAQRESFLDREHVAERHWLQHLSRREVGWTLLENQFGSGRKHALHRHYRRGRNNLLLRNDRGEFEQRGKRVFQSDNRSDSWAVVRYSARKSPTCRMVGAMLPPFPA